MDDYITLYQRRQFKVALNIILAGVLAGLTYPVFGDGFGHWLPFVNGFEIGLIGGIAVALFELRVFNPQNRGVGFIALHCYKVLTYLIFFTLLVVLVKGFNDSLFLGTGFLEHLTSIQFQDFLMHGDFVIIEFYVFVMISLIIFARQIIRKMGRRVFSNFITGKYHRPREEDKVFLFMDLKGSTSIGEKLGDMKFHQLICDFFYDITASILTFQGEVYRYVGDEIVVVWDLDSGVENANCIRVHFDAKRRIWKNRERYLEKYDLVPDFRSVINYGQVFAGEIGDVKSQIIYQGRVLYITREMARQSRNQPNDLVMSASLVNQLDLPLVYQAVECEPLLLGPDNDPLQLMAIQENGN